MDYGVAEPTGRVRELSHWWHRGLRAEEGSISSHKRREGCTLSNSSGCKRQLSRRHVLADLGDGQMGQREKPWSDSLY
jgi:hypothetical protein